MALTSKTSKQGGDSGRGPDTDRRGRAPDGAPSVLECPLRLKTRAAGSFQSLALQEKTGFPFERERVCVCVAVRESCGVACEPFALTIAPVRGSRQ